MNDFRNKYRLNKVIIFGIEVSQSNRNVLDVALKRYAESIRAILIWNANLLNQINGHLSTANIS